MTKESAYKENVHSVHRKGMEKRFLLTEGTRFSQHELLEMLLFYTMPRANTNEAAFVILNRYGSLKKVFSEGTYADFKSISGIGEKTAVFLSLLCAVFKASKETESTVTKFSTSSDCCDFFLNELKQEKSEVVMAACLSDKRKIVRYEKLETGAAGHVKIDLQKLTKFILQTDCTTVALAHNHPVGSAIPSYPDIVETKKIKEFLNMMNIDLYDHIVVGDGKAYSMAEHRDI